MIKRIYNLKKTNQYHIQKRITYFHKYLIKWTHFKNNFLQIHNNIHLITIQIISHLKINRKDLK